MWLDVHRYQTIVGLLIMLFIIFLISAYTGWMHAKRDNDWKMGALVTALLVGITMLYGVCGLVPLYRANALDYAKIQILTGK